MVDSLRQVRRLWGVDAAFTSFAKAAGASTADEAWELLFTPDGVSKMSPDVADVHVPGGLSVRWSKRRRKAVRPFPPDSATVVNKLAPPIPKMFRKPPVSKPKRTFKPLSPGAGKMLAAGFGGAGTLYAAQKVTKNPDAVLGRVFKPKNPDADIAYGKSVDWEATFSKVDDEKRQVFGWASIVSVDGKPVIDRQGDVIELEEIEKSAYDYVINSRTGGRQHRRDVDGKAFKASDMIESLVVTPEKREHLGLPSDSPTGWWVGFKVHDDDTWAAVKRGEVTGFSIHGTGKRVPIEGDFTPERTEVA